MLYEDTAKFFETMRRLKRKSCNFEIGGAAAPSLIEYGTENFVGDWNYRKIDGGISYCIYLTDEGDRLLMLLGFSEHQHHYGYNHNDGKRWFRG